MLTALFYLAAFLLVISIVVAVHEWGHYAAGRTIGLKVDAFSIGMGPELYGRRDRNGCRWRIALLPIGGYVKFAGDADGGGGAPSKNIPAGLTDHEIYHRRGPLARTFVLIAGPAVNILLGLGILASLYLINGRPYTPPVVGEVVAGSPAEEAGIMPDDRILTIDGVTMDSFEDVYETVALRPLTDLTIGLERNGQSQTTKLTTESVVTESMGTPQTIGRIGIGAADMREILPVGPVAAVAHASRDVALMSTSMFVAIGQIATGQRSLDDMGGPVKVAEMSGKAAEIGLMTLIFFLALISVNIGIVNLLPLGILDGGQILMCGIEAIRRRPFSPAALTRYNAASIVFLFGLMAILTVNDVRGVIGRAFG